ncbi:MAG: hypothetical protein NDJ89_18860 [Oligoflexia bacterium]|nr:hypothetical protein [Oligoflexia bacterium]
MEYFQLLKRVGAFRTALLRLERLEELGSELRPELRKERAVLLGELGATEQAVSLLAREPAHSRSIAFDRSVAYHLGNFYSLLHRYEDAERQFERMKDLSKGAHDRSDELGEMIARLNILGSRIYAGKNVPASLNDLAALNQDSLHEKYPLLAQGAHYFRAVGFLQLDRLGAARAALDAAMQLGVSHNLRESLLLKLSRFHLDIRDRPGASGITASRCSLLRREVLAQPHIVYFDQLHSLIALHASLQGNRPRMQRHRDRVLFGNRKHRHLELASSLGDERKNRFWELRRFHPSLVTRRKLTACSLRLWDLPILTSPRGAFSLASVGETQRNLILALAGRLDFGMRDAELWQSVWREPYRQGSSPGAIRQALFRLRESPIGNLLEIRSHQSRLSLRLQEGVTLITSP